MVNHEHKFVFLHIPKTAGMSVGRTLYKMLGIEERYEGFKIHHDDLTKDILENYYIFTFVRNPWDRLYSSYKFRDWLYEYYSFNSVVPNIEKHFEVYFNAKIIAPDKHEHKVVKMETALQRADYYGEFVHLPSQVQYLKGKYNDEIDKFPYINYIGRLETIQEDFDNICKEIGLPQTELLRENVSIPGKVDYWTNPNEPKEIKHYSQIYSKENIEFVRTKYADDIKKFNYDYKDINTVL